MTETSPKIIRSVKGSDHLMFKNYRYNINNSLKNLIENI